MIQNENKKDGSKKNQKKNQVKATEETLKIETCRVKRH